MTHAEMIATYNHASAAHDYALGFTHKHELYAVRVSFDELTSYLKPSRVSSKRGGWAQVRIRLTSADRAELAPRAEKLGSEDLLVKDPHHNRGENFERELTERWTSETWVKDSVPFTVAGDIKVGGVEVQVKLDGAELTNERALRHLLGL